MKKFLLLVFVAFNVSFISAKDESDYYAKLITEVDAYIQNISSESQLEGKMVVDMCLKHDVDIVFVLAQGQIESHYGTAGAASRTNSVFNVGAYDGTSSKTQISRGFGFEHPNDSVEPYLILLKNNYLVNGTCTESLLRNFVNKNGQRYATYSGYEQALRSVYNKINKTTNIKHYQSLM